MGEPASIRYVLRNEAPTAESGRWQLVAHRAAPGQRGFTACGRTTGPRSRLLSEPPASASRCDECESLLVAADAGVHPDRTDSLLPRPHVGARTRVRFGRLLVSATRKRDGAEFAVTQDGIEYLV